MAEYTVDSGVTGNDDQVNGSLTGADFTRTYAIAPNDSNDGSTARPWKTPDYAATQMVAGDILNMIGRHYFADATLYAFSKTKTNGIKLRGVVGQPPPQLKMSNRVGAVGWTPVGGGVYTLSCNGTVSSAALPAGVVPDLRGKVASITFWCIDYDWTGNQDAATLTGLVIHKSFVPILASAAAAAAAAGTAQGGIFLDNTTGLLTLGLPTGQAAPSSPHACGIEYVYAGRTGIGVLATDATQNTGWVIDGLNIGPCNGAGAAPAGCGIAVQNFQGTISNNNMSDTGVHGISNGGGNGAAMRSTYLVNNTYSGGANGTYHEVFNPTTGATASNCRSYNPLMGGWTPLGCDGLYIASGTSVGGALTHGDANSCTDVEWVNMQFKTYVPPSGSPCETIPYSLANGPAPASDDPELCGTRLRQYNPKIWTVKDATDVPDQTVTQYIGLINTRMDFSQFRALNNLHCVNVGTVTGKLIAYGCDFTATVSNPNGGTHLFNCGANAAITLINCSAYDNSTQAQHSGAQAYTLFNFGNAAAVYTVKGCILGFRDTAGAGTRGLCSGDGSIAAASHVFSDNEYWNIGATLYSLNATFSSAANWLGLVDTTGIGVVPVLGANPFSDITAAAGLALTGSERRRRKRLTRHARRGSNGKLYAGNYGSNQEGQGPRGRRKAGPRGRST